MFFFRFLINSTSSRGRAQLLFCSPPLIVYASCPGQENPARMIKGVYIIDPAERRFISNEVLVNLHFRTVSSEGDCPGSCTQGAWSEMTFWRWKRVSSSVGPDVSLVSLFFDPRIFTPAISAPFHETQTPLNSTILAILDFSFLEIKGCKKYMTVFSFRFDFVKKSSIVSKLKISVNSSLLETLLNGIINLVKN